jgi:hypothetical protein
VEERWRRRWWWLSRVWWWRVMGMIGWVCWERAVPRLVLHARSLARSLARLAQSPSAEAQPGMRSPAAGSLSPWTKSMSILVLRVYSNAVLVVNAVYGQQQQKYYFSHAKCILARRCSERVKFLSQGQQRSQAAFSAGGEQFYLHSNLSSIRDVPRESPHCEPTHCILVNHRPCQLRYYISTLIALGKAISITLHASLSLQ